MGPVLEMGTGLFSTPLLHWMCLDQKRELVCYENLKEYYDMVAGFATDSHQIHLIENWDDVNIEKHWGVVLIDHGPDERRIVDVKRVMNYADFIVLHDTNRNFERHTHYSEIWPLFKYRYNYRRQQPYTSVVSNFFDVVEVLSK